ncbi:MAG TPA: NPCBM/NEW2 domain-containing protein [Blastocatellia bacterium]|nr:NPCBM/NEW2 domain-containing protein [Blastocatellia bacterium]
MTYSLAPAKSMTSLFFLLFFFTSSPQAQNFSAPGFSTQVVTTLPAYKPVGLTFAPDGRMFIWQENGIVRIFKNGVLLPTPFLDISSRVNIVGDRGLLGLVLDPNFVTNGYVYLFYTYEPTGNPNEIGAKTGRVTRVKADPANPDVVLPNSEVVILGSLSNTPCAENTDCVGNDTDSHTGGTLRFGPDGKLYVSIGDGGSYAFEDPLALRSQSLNYLNGKILRLNPDGTAPSDNPFYNGNPNAVRSKVYAYGFRNPYRFAIHPTTGEVLVGDVGWVTYEEINRGRGANFGWPCYEGDAPQASYQNRFPAQCGALPSSAVTKPIHFYPRSEGVAVIGGTVYNATQFPATYRGNFFYADYVGQWIKRLVFDANGNVSSVQPFATNAGDIVSLEQGLDGALYYIALASGQVRRIRFASAPTAVATANPTVGVSPLTVTFSSAGSSDPANSPLTYLWEFGDGTTSTQANPVHTYTTATYTNFTAKLTVTNSSNASSSATVTISVGNRPPTATITTPANNTSARPGDSITYSGTASDPDEPLSGNAMSWQLLLHHDDHVHPFQSVNGAGGSFLVEDHGAGTFYYEIVLTVTDSRGATDRKSVRVNVTSSTQTTTYLSDLNWVSATNGWGPIEKDRSNNDLSGTDGNPIRLNGVTYAKGLGVHANSDVRYNLNGLYKTFMSDVGVDDEVGTNGSVVFRVYLDGVLAFDSGLMTGATATKQVNVDVTGKNELRLVVTIGPDHDWYDHADWANARLLTGGTTNAAPSVTLTSPANNATFAAPANITLSANASDSNGTISKVEFYQGATLLGSDTSSPYSFAWGNVAAGTYSLTAKAFDNLGATTTSSAVNITVTAPTATTTYLSDLNWASATNGWGPVEKDRSNNDLSGTDGNPIRLNGVTYPKGLGVHAYSDVRYNLNGAYRTFQSDIGVDDEVGNNGSVVFQVFVDGVLAYDSGLMTGATATKQVNVDVTGKNELRLYVSIGPDHDWYDHADWANARLLTGTVPNAAPTVSLTAPSNGATFTAPANITLTANAADNDGSINRVEFYQGTTLLGSDTTSPYSFVWSNVAAGTYSLTAKAFDNAGATTTSNAVSITVNALTSTTTYLSDLNWASAINGWGPVEKDRSNNDLGATDGNPLRLGGVTYAKGLGVHANSDVRYNLNGAYKTFLSDIGVDDEVGTNGSVVFQVYVDGVLAYDSGLMTGATATKQISLDVTGKNELRLVVTIGPDHDWYDHADWANARLLK